MDAIYLIIVAFILILAIFDLVVGVSNDAVNFLNSAIGAKVAKFKTIDCKCFLILPMGEVLAFTS